MEFSRQPVWKDPGTTSTRVPVAGRTASPSTARTINDRLALQLLKDGGPLTAGQLKTLTGLSRPTIADLVERLRAAGLVAVVGESGAERRGPTSPACRRCVRGYAPGRWAAAGCCAVRC